MEERMHRRLLVHIMATALVGLVPGGATTAIPPRGLETSLMQEAPAGGADIRAARPAPRTSPSLQPGGPIEVHGAGGRPLDRARTSRGGPRTIRYETGFVAGEPTLGFAKDGTIYYQTWDIASNLPVPGVIRSTDDGRTWKDVSPGPGPMESHEYALDPHLYVDPDTGRVITASFLLPCHKVSFSDDRGKTWVTSRQNCNMGDREIIFGGPPPKDGPQPEGYPNILYFCTAAQAYLYNTCNRSLDGGETWLPGGVTFEMTPEETARYSSIASSNGFVDRRGTVYVTKADYYGQPFVAISGDTGLTWERVQVSDLGSQWHDAGIGGDRKGNLYHAWIANDRLPYLVISRDRGETWSKPIMVGPPGIKEASQPELAVRPDGAVAITYMGSTTSPYQRCEMACGAADYEDTTWNGYITFTKDALTKSPVFFTGSVNSPKEPLVRGTCRQQRCQGTLDFHDVAFDPRGSAWATFVNTCFEDSCDHRGPLLNTPYGMGILGRLVGGPLSGRND